MSHHKERHLMFTRISRAATVLGLLAALTAVLASSASASTWHSNVGTGSPAYSGAFTATSGPGTLTGPTAALSCASATATGTIGAASFGANAWPDAAFGTVTFNTCLIGGQSVSVSCAFTLKANSTTGTASPALSAVTTGTIALTGPATLPGGCSVVRLGVEICKVVGSTVPATYTNPSTVGGTDGRLGIAAVAASSGNLATRNGSGGACSVGVGPAALTALTFTTSAPAPVPIIWITNP
jgi:hypothetical protein